jgi:hypothetical protein
VIFEDRIAIVTTIAATETKKKHANEIVLSIASSTVYAARDTRLTRKG